MNLFELFASLTLNTQDYDKNIEEAKKKGEGFADHTEKKVSQKAAAGWAAIAAAIIAVVKAIARLAKASMDYADNVGDIAAKYGLATDSISEMQYIADQSSTTVEGLVSAMTMLLNRAKENGDGFKELGVNVYDTNGQMKQMDELFYETVGALNSIESEGEKSRLMLETFGRSAMSVGEVVRKTSDELARMRKEAHDLGIVMEQNTLDFASDFNDAIAVLKLQFNSTMATMVAGEEGALERFDSLMNNLLEKADYYLPHFIQFFVRFLHVIGTELMSYAPNIIADVLGLVIEQLLNINWFGLGTEIALSMVEGVLNIFGSVFSGFSKAFGGEGLEKIDFGIDLPSTWTETQGGSYSVKQEKKVKVEIEATGDTPTSKATAEETARALAPYLDEILGGK